MDDAFITFPARQLDKIEPVKWQASNTAVIICDMWDKTICKSAERRVVEIAPRLDGWIKELRQKGVFIIHAPSSVMGFYEGTVERKRAQSAPFVKSEIPVDEWRDFDPSREGPLPVEDDDWCDDTPKCPIKEIEEQKAWPWTRQIAAIEIKPEDAVSDDEQEIYNLMAERGIENILITGVHLIPISIISDSFVVAIGSWF